MCSVSELVQGTRYGCPNHYTCRQKFSQQQAAVVVRRGKISSQKRRHYGETNLVRDVRTAARVRTDLRKSAVTPSQEIQEQQFARHVP